MPHVRCPVCRNTTGSEADGVVIRTYRPHVENGRLVGTLRPLYPDELYCPVCYAGGVKTVLLVKRRGEWRLARSVK